MRAPQKEKAQASLFYLQVSLTLFLTAQRAHKGLSTVQVPNRLLQITRSPRLQSTKWPVRSRRLRKDEKR